MYSVLIVEDETMIRNGLKILIPWEKYGFVIAGAAEGGSRALELMSARYFDVVVTDVRMPRIDGLELIRTMRERNIGSEVIILSGYRNFEYARTAIEYGVRNYLLKPIDTEELVKAINAIRTVLDRKSGCAEDDDGELVMRVKSYIALNYGEEISVRTVGEALHYNEVYLGRVFLKKAGLSFHDYLNQVRTRQAAELLAEGGRMVSDVAMQVGYKDLNYFCRVFKGIYGVPPSKYKKRT